MICVLEAKKRILTAGTKLNAWLPYGGIDTGRKKKKKTAGLFRNLSCGGWKKLCLFLGDNDGPFAVADHIEQIVCRIR